MEKDKTEDYQISLESANKEIKLADHLFYITYPNIKDLKFLASIVEHIIKGMQFALEALLEFEKLYKRIGPFPKDFEVEIDIFKSKLYHKYHFDVTHLNLLRRLSALKKCIKNSILRFKRQERFIFTTRNYDTEAIDENDVRQFIRFSKDFLSRIEGSITKKETKKLVTYE